MTFHRYRDIWDYLKDWILKFADHVSSTSGRLCVGNLGEGAEGSEFRQFKGQ